MFAMTSEDVKDEEKNDNTPTGGRNGNSDMEVQKKVMLGILFAVIFFVIVFSIVVGLSLQVKSSRYVEHQKQLCDRIKDYTRTKILEGTGLNKTPEVVDINRCIKGNDCTFNVLSCATPCPLGFEMNGECAVSCKCATHGIMQLDVQFDEETVPAILEQMDEDPSEDFAVFEPESGIELWNEYVLNGRPQIPYNLDEKLDPEHKEAILQAFAIFRDKTCLEFIPRTDHPDYLHIQNGDGDCSASYSRHPGRNILNVASCYSYSHVLHVLMHSLGFHHEHMREDRDAYINIVWDNVDPAYENAFNKLNPQNYIISNSEFDKNSIMTLDGYAFSKTHEEKVDPTMLDLDTKEALVGGGSILTANDIEDIVSVYCDGAPENSLANSVQRSMMADTRSAVFALSWTEWSKWSRCQKTCGPSIRTRTRQCKMFDFISYGCKGRSREGRTCQIRPCDITVKEARWEPWGQWGKCSKSCGTGIMMKYRKCSVKGACRGKGRKSKGKKCNTEQCEDDKPLFSEWTSWGECMTTCGKSSRIRKRECLDKKGRKSFKCTEGEIDDRGFETHIEMCDRPCSAKVRSLNLDDIETLAIPPKLSEMKFIEGFDQKATIIANEMCDPLPNNHWFIGDFNGDGRTDTMCGESADLLKVFLTNFDGTSYMRWMGRLNCAIDHIYIGDFNGDRSDDVFCKDSLMTRNFIYKSIQGGAFYQHDDAGPFCMNIFDKIEVLDINGDGKSDLICRHTRIFDDTDIYVSSLS
nr:uncharacterized protein LOC120327843 isoform X2 [Styela clava]